jgi:hypothetical protein
LIKALAQAHRWWRDLRARRYETMRELGVAYGTNERYAAFMMRLAFLSPELTAAIINRIQPTGLALHRLLRSIKFPAS